MGRFTTIIIALLLALSGGCMPPNSWRLNDYSDRLTYPSADAMSAQEDEARITNFLPTLGFKQADAATHDQPVTEAAFIRSDNDHFHMTVTVRCLARLDAPGWVTVVDVVAYNIGEEGTRAAGKSLLNEIDQWHRTHWRSGVPVPEPVPPTAPATTQAAP